MRVCDELQIPLYTVNFVQETLSGKVIGKHQGAVFYTIGQRKGLKIGGAGKAWFVVGKDIERNVVFVEQGENHPALFRPSLTASQASWIAGTPQKTFRCTAKIRYRLISREICN